MAEKRGLTKWLWLFMLEHGGRWTINDLTDQCGHNGKYVERIVWSMVKVGSVTKARSGERKNGVAFGVSAKGRIPQGVTLAEVLKATSVREVMQAEASNDAQRRKTA